MNLQATFRMTAVATTLAIALAATQAQAATLIEDSFDRANADLSASPLMDTAGYEWEIAANTGSYVEEFKPLIQGNELRIERVSGSNPKDFADTMFVTETASGDVLQVADGRAKIQLVNVPTADVDISNNQYISFNYRTVDTDASNSGSQYGYTADGGYHAYFRGFNDSPGTSMQVALVYRDPAGDNFLVSQTWTTTPSDFPDNPWLEVEWEGDQHTLTLYEDDGTTVYFTGSGTDNTRTDGYFGVTHGFWDASLDVPGGSLSTPLDNFELEIPEPASMALLGLGGLVMFARRSRRQD